jgi:geranylgeranyl pyrophosphate synthase
MTIHLAWQEARARVDARLAALLADEPVPLRDALAPALEGGKRLRPAVLLWVHDALGGPEPALADRWAAAVELIHCATLMHDDLVDGDTTRRGRPATHARLGAGLAALAGDAAVVSGLALVAQPKAAQLVGAALRDVWLGAWAEARGEGDYVEVATLKTGRLVALAAELGALAAHAPEAERARAAAYGTRLGLAYQLADDALDAPLGAPPPALLRASAAAEAARARHLASGFPSTDARRWLEGFPEALLAATLTMEAKP